MLYSVNYLTHFNVMRRSIVEAVGNWRPETDGAQDWDIFYRVTEQSRKIARVPGIHYHWRIISTSTATGLSAKPYAALGQLRTQEDRIKRLALPATVLPDMDGGFRLLWRLEVKPCLDLVVRGRADSVQLNRFLTTLSKELDDLVSSITLVRHSGDSEGQYTPEIFGSTPFYQFTYDSPLDETDAIVKASHNGTAPVIVFVDSEIVSFGENWLRELTGWVHLHPDISFAGAIVLEKNEVVVECGRVVGENGRSLPLFRNMPLRHWSWFGGPLWFRNVSAVSPCTAACKREDWNNTKGMDDNTKPWMETFTTRCKAMLIRGRRGLVTPHARVYLDSMPDEPLPAWDDSFTKDPYFHPAFRSVTPLMLKE